MLIITHCSKLLIENIVENTAMYHAQRILLNTHCYLLLIACTAEPTLLYTPHSAYY